MHATLSTFIVLILLIARPAAVQAKAGQLPREVYVYGSEAMFDFRLNHTLAVVKAALEVDADRLGTIEVRSTADRDLWMNRSRALASIEKGKELVNVISSFASRDLDERLLPIRVSIAASALGERVFLVRPEKRQELDAVASLDDLKKYTIGIGQNWIDANIMQHAGLRVQDAVRYDLLFTMLQGRRFDLLSRAAHEGWDELRTRGFRELDWTGAWGLSYPAPFYLYVNKNQKALADRLQKGLQKLAANGTLDRLYLEHFGLSMLRSGWLDRRRISLKNPYLPLLPPLGFASWDAWHKKADEDLHRIVKEAKAKYRPSWSGTYRPQRLIEQFAHQKTVSPLRPGVARLIVRAADRSNDTHILAAVFALELALAHPINKLSPSFRNPVQYLIDKSLDQERALEGLNQINPFVDAVATQSSREREKVYLNATVDIAQGLIGQRVLVVRKKDGKIFKDVKSLADLRRFKLCVGSTWPDRGVLEGAGIPVLTRTLTHELYEALLRGDCHGLTRAVYEVRDEILARPLGDVDVDPYLLLSYPAGQKLFFSREKKEMAEAAEKGLQAMQSQGLLKELLDVLYGDSITAMQPEGRRIIGLANPLAPQTGDPETR